MEAPPIDPLAVLCVLPPIPAGHAVAFELCGGQVRIGIGRTAPKDLHPVPRRLVLVGPPRLAEVVPLHPPPECA